MKRHSLIVMTALATALIPLTSMAANAGSSTAPTGPLSLVYKQKLIASPFFGNVVANQVGYSTLVKAKALAKASVKVIDTLNFDVLKGIQLPGNTTAAQRFTSLKETFEKVEANQNANLFAAAKNLPASYFEIGHKEPAISTPASRDALSAYLDPYKAYVADLTSHFIKNPLLNKAINSPTAVKDLVDAYDKANPNSDPRVRNNEIYDTLLDIFSVAMLTVIQDQLLPNVAKSESLQLKRTALLNTQELRDPGLTENLLLADHITKPQVSVAYLHPSSTGMGVTSDSNALDIRVALPVASFTVGAQLISARDSVTSIADNNYRGTRVGADVMVAYPMGQFTVQGNVGVHRTKLNKTLTETVVGAQVAYAVPMGIFSMTPIVGLDAGFTSGARYVREVVKSRFAAQVNDKLNLSLTPSLSYTAFNHDGIKGALFHSMASYLKDSRRFMTYGADMGLAYNVSSAVSVGANLGYTHATNIKTDAVKARVNLTYTF